ncbi:MULTISPECIES: beta-ketoacyl-[acyl-carrier-protein] synthase family protein [Streptomyces]|uniref:beta-ketoacyl-[acyl-carrier-protein] synthase family protein n=1 Tax=Streptomyces TaxID=1883 RepID=UPI001E479FCD|nr:MULTISPECIES: beta-ketoacyl-[acyl-carrier-protein] synthase family protein [Streptomyces]UFQ19314.1 beta-ketoacyl-[acyl-carrier-protein] synthase family protein [Streptomyces huasconensis]WCL88934.1 beta-ketoacyl-[acyl-carrier-protein] synthase family protein [Streptomyces sp. JCM 35825]
MPQRDAVAVTGLGLITPAGNDPGTFWKSIAAGRSMARTDPELAGLPVDMACRVEDFDPVVELGNRLARRLDRFAHLGIVAARRAAADAGLRHDRWDPERTGVVLGVGSNSLRTYTQEFTRLDQGRPRRVSPLALPRSVPSTAAGEVALDLGAQGPNFTVSSACASGSTALGTARDLLLSGACDVVLAGGCEAGSAMTATCFAQMRALSTRVDRPAHACRPFDRDRDGFVLGEGAAVLVLERAEHARARGASPRAWLRGYGASADAHHATAPHPEGAGAERAVRRALADAGCAPGDIGHVNAHGTATRLGDTAEALMLLRVFRGAPPAVTAIKSIIGHALGAAGAIEAVCTVLALQHQRVPPTANLTLQDPGRELDVVTARPRDVDAAPALSTSFGFGGQNAALVFAPA